MIKYLFLIIAICLIFNLTGCSREQEPLEESQEPLSIELPSEPTVPIHPSLESEIPLPPQGPYKPTNKQIQTALKNAGYYTAAIDGEIGPLTKKAIEQFQADNNLKVDGKVGPKTWAILSSYLSPQELETYSE